MRAFEYVRATTKEQAVKLLSKEGAAALAGGTDLLSLMKDGAVQYSRLVDLKSIPELSGIRLESGELRIGALVTLRELLQDPAVADEYPSLLQAAEGVRSPQIRNRGTVAGDLCQRPRCWYYRNGFGLLGLQEGKSMIVDGDNRYHAILGNDGPAYFVNPSSLAPALIALDARLQILGSGGERTAKVAEFFRAPTSELEKEYRLAPDELVTAVIVPSSAGARNATYEVRQKEALDWPLAAASVSLRLENDRVTSSVIVLGHVAPVPWVSSEAADLLKGKPLNQESADETGRAAVEKAVALSRNEYKIRLARVAVKRALLRAVGKEV